jgi:hypothetical protein
MSAMRLFAFAIVLTACVSMPGAHRWEEETLKRQASVDLECPPERIATYDAGKNAFTARGCGKRCGYQKRSCNRVTRECTFVPTGAVSTDYSGR